MSSERSRGIQSNDRNRSAPRGKTGKDRKEMIKLRKKTTATLLIAIFMVSAFAVAMHVSAITIIGNKVYGAHLEHPDWSGSGILVAGSSDVLASDNYADSCDLGIAIIGYTDYRDAPAVDNIIEYNFVENCEVGIGVQLNSMGAIIRYNDASNNDVGVESAGSLSWETSVPSGTETHYNNIVDNAEFGVASIVWELTGEADEVDATLNWWGHASGPSGEYGRVNKAGKVIGKGDSVSLNVDWDPWLRNQLEIRHTIQYHLD